MCENPNLCSQIAHERETMFKEEKHGDTLDELGVGSSTANGEQNLITATNPTFPGGKKTALLRKLQTQLWKLRGLKDRSWREIVFMVWLIGTTCLVVVLLTIPPPPTVSADFNLGLIPVGASVLTMVADIVLNRKYSYDAIAKIDWCSLDVHGSFHLASRI